MMAKDSVKKRSGDDKFTEFTPPINSGYDFYHLNKDTIVWPQAGGSDQWGLLQQEQGSS
jgi:tyrosyl-tRNA synthetase